MRGCLGCLVSAASLRRSWKRHCDSRCAGHSDRASVTHSWVIQSSDVHALSEVLRIRPAQRAKCEKGEAECLVMAAPLRFGGQDTSRVLCLMVPSKKICNTSHAFFFHRGLVS